MEKLKNEEDIEICVERFRELITDQIGIDMLVEGIDEIMYEYAQYTILDNELTDNRKSEATKLYYLKALRDLFVKKYESPFKVDK
jgi:hypothetical protein